MSGADVGHLLLPTGKCDRLRRTPASGSECSSAALSAAGASPAFATPTSRLDTQESALQQNRLIITGTPNLSNESADLRAARVISNTPLAAAAAASSSSTTSVTVPTKEAGASSARPQRPRRPPRKFEVDDINADTSFRKALEKSRLETRRVDIDYASLPSIPEIKFASFEEFLVNPVAFYERLERYGREFGGVKIVPPEGWRPPFCLHELLEDALEFHVRVQDIHKLMQGAEKDRQMKRQQFGTEKPLLEQIEALYWQSVETSVPELTVHYAADLKTNEVGSGFPTQRTDERRHIRQQQSGILHFDANPECTHLRACGGGYRRHIPVSGSGTHAAASTQENSAEQVTGDEGDGTFLREGPTRLRTQKTRTGRTKGGRTDAGPPAAPDLPATHASEAVDCKTSGLDTRRYSGEGVHGALTEAKAHTDSTDVENDVNGARDSISHVRCIPTYTNDARVHRGKKKITFSTEDWDHSCTDNDGVCTDTCYTVDEDHESKLNENAAFYATHPWNLTRFARQRGSLLSSYHRDVAGVTSPWLYVGMIFSTFCWHAEDNYFAACNYHHWGDAKLWYIIPPSRAPSVERMLQRYLNTKDSDYVLHSLTVQLPPSLFIQHRVPVYRVEQKENEFVMLWPRTYHAGFNAGFNCNEACNFAPASWLPWGHRSIYSYRFMRSTCIPFHQLLLRAACNAEGLAASQLLHMCQALLRLLHEEYALRRTAKEERVATGLMSLGDSHVSQLDVLTPDSGGVCSELLSCRPALQYIVGKPLLPQTVYPVDSDSSHNSAAGHRSGVAACNLPDLIIVPGNGEAVAHPVSEIAGRSAENVPLRATSQIQSFLEIVAAVASLPVKDCDNCRSCCAISCVTCPHVVEHTCLECLGQQTCSCKLQVALIRFPLPTLWAVFDHVRSLFLSLCKHAEEEEDVRREAVCAGNNLETSSEMKIKVGGRLRGTPSSIENNSGYCKQGSAAVERRTESALLFDAAEHARVHQDDLSGIRRENQGRFPRDEAFRQTVDVESGGDSKVSHSVEEGFRAYDVRKNGGDGCQPVETRPDAVSVLYAGEPCVAADHPVSSGQICIPEACLMSEEVRKSAAPQSEHDKNSEMHNARSAAQGERRVSQQGHGHRGATRKNRKPARSRSGVLLNRSKKREDELLEDPLYIGLPSLEELLHFEEAAQLLESFTREYSRSTSDVNNTDSTVPVDAREDWEKGKGNGVFGKLGGLAKVLAQDASVSENGSARRGVKSEKTPEKEPKDIEPVDALESPAPPAVTFEERRGSLYMRGKNWSVEAVVSYGEVEAVGMASEKRQSPLVEGKAENYATASQEPLNPLKGPCATSCSSHECSPASPRCNTSALSSPFAKSAVSVSSMKKRRAAECITRYRRADIQRKRRNGLTKRSTAAVAQHSQEKMMSSAEAIKVLVRQLTWRYFLSALKDEEEDNDERILPLFRKTGTQHLNKHEIYRA